MIGLLGVHRLRIPEKRDKKHASLEAARRRGFDPCLTSAVSLVLWMYAN
jgi:hypothetical protein